MTIKAFLAKNKQQRRRRLVLREALDHVRKVGHAPNISTKQHRKFTMRSPISDAHFCDDLSYVPFRFIRGTLHLPGAEADKAYVAQ